MDAYNLDVMRPLEIAGKFDVPLDAVRIVLRRHGCSRSSREVALQGLGSPGAAAATTAAASNT